MQQTITVCKLLVAMLFILSSKKSVCQEQKALKTILAHRKTGKIYKTATINDTTWRTYLGALKDKDKKEKYFVISEFNKTRAALTWHGHSTIYFFNPEKKRVASVYVAMPDNLPYKLENNTFYFKYIEHGVTNNYKMTMQTPLPKVFCSRQNGCDEITFD